MNFSYYELGEKLKDKTTASHQNSFSASLQRFYTSLHRRRYDHHSSKTYILIWYFKHITLKSPNSVQWLRPCDCEDHSIWLTSFSHATYNNYIPLYYFKATINRHILIYFCILRSINYRLFQICFQHHHKKSRICSEYAQRGFHIYLTCRSVPFFNHRPKNSTLDVGAKCFTKSYFAS